MDRMRFLGVVFILYGMLLGPLSDVVLLMNVQAHKEEIYVMDADGQNPRNLTNNPWGDGSPAWSPDGREIAFVSNRDGNSEIYVMDTNGKNVRRLTYHSAPDRKPSWFDPAVPFSLSPQGKRVTTWGWLKMGK